MQLHYCMAQALFGRPSKVDPGHIRHTVAPVNAADFIMVDNPAESIIAQSTCSIDLVLLKKATGIDIVQPDSVICYIL